MKITKFERCYGTHAHSSLTISRRNRIISVPEKIFVKEDPNVTGDLFPTTDEIFCPYQSGVKL